MNRESPQQPHVETLSVSAESPALYFEELAAALRYRPHYARVYNAMTQTFKKCLNEKTDQTQIIFAGDFAKTDYLLKEYDAPRRLSMAINDTRVRLRKRYELSAVDLERFCLFDLKNLCQFIAFLYKTDIPPQLIALLPTEKVPSFTPLLVGECLRVIVDHWDDTMVYVHADAADGDELKTVCYARGNNVYKDDWTYLRALFHEGAQLNLVRPREDDGIVYPELIIYEPDYLVNITTVAHCFTNYADSPMVELIKQLEPATTSEAIVLGNLAGQMLDESIHQLPETHTYAQSVTDFFRDNAISLLTAGVGAQFHEEARRQRQHIARAMQVTLPAKLGRFNSKEGIVEPSFYSEMLGLQGRMDYLQLDFSVLMEQKSGKGAFPYDHYVTPRQTDEHYVQMLLYVALLRYNYHEAYERNKGVQAFLLYSKYSESLLALGAAPELVFKAIRIRNELVALQLQLTQPDRYRQLLEQLTPEQLNEKHVNNPLWTNYQYKQIASVLDPIHRASVLERAYFFRFLTFIANEQAMSKLGNKTKECSGFAATWHDPLEDKRQAGNIYDRLTLVLPNEETTGRIKTVELRFSETDENDMSNFRVGDIVILYPYPKDKEPDARRTMVLRCTIEDIQAGTIRLTLRAAQSDSRIFMLQTDRLWAIEHDFIESSYSSQYKGMHAFLSAPQERRDLLLLQREPTVDCTRQLKGSYGEFDELALRVKQAQDLFLIIGPPGTGKTSFGMLYTVKEELLEPDASVLLLSYTNRAVDEICSKLVEEGIDFIRLGVLYGCQEEYREKLLSERAQQSANLTALQETLASARVIVGTTAALSSNIALFQLKQFTLAVIDEASQILEPHLIGLLSAQANGVPAIKKMVMIGDHKQLPAVVQQKEEVSRVVEPILNDIYLIDCRLSLFERLLRRYASNPSVTYMLRKQGRMHPDIALFPNHAFYADQLLVVPRPHQTVSLPTAGEGVNGIVDLLTTRRIAFIAVPSPEDSPSDKVNADEAEMIAAMVVKIYEMEQESGFDVNRTVGVIVPYRNQIATVRKAIDKWGIPLLHNITIDTVERYQGSQRKYILYGFTIQKYYQLKFLTDNVFEDFDGSIVDRKLNVAMTRAEEHLVMLGNPALLSKSDTFARLLEFVRSRNCYFRIAKDDFIAGRFTL